MAVSRRRWMAGAFLAPFAARPLAERAGSDVPRFAAPLSGREVMRTRYFPNVPLVTHQGKAVRFYDDLLKDKVVVINMMYAVCDGICPTITANLVKAQKLLRARGRQELFIYSITVKPEEDTPAKLRDYADMHGVGDNWLFLTGRPDDVERLRVTLGFVDLRPEVDRDKAQHSGVIRYGNEPLSLWGACPGNAKPEWIAEEISFVMPRG
ncbi:MAG: SCO family protein [Tepidisphaeraceae bacterium]